jgi:hypothetical protein
MKRPDEKELRKFNVYYKYDTDFASHARLLQSKWREKNGWKMNDKRGSNYGNFVETAFAQNEKVNFLTDNIKNLVVEKIKEIKNNGGLVGEPRIWNNLLSSQPLCFNLFGELCCDPDLATKFFKTLFPNRLDSVTSVKFEHSPGRGDTKYIGDHSAFDAFVEYTKDNKKGFIGIEVKYAESLREETKKTANKYFKEQYATLTNACGLFKPDSVDFLRQPPLSQIWRDHLLCIATRQDYDEGFFVFLFPSENSHCQKGVDSYKRYLTFDNEEQNCFYPRHLEDFINTLVSISNADWTIELKNRYLGSNE